MSPNPVVGRLRGTDFDHGGECGGHHLRVAYAYLGLGLLVSVVLFVGLLIGRFAIVRPSGPDWNFVLVLITADDRLNGIVTVVYRENEDDDYDLAEQITKDLKFARDHLHRIKSSIYGWDDEDGA